MQLLVTTPFDERTHRVKQRVLSYELASAPRLSSCFGGCETDSKLYREEKYRYGQDISQRSDHCTQNLLA